MFNLEISGLEKAHSLEMLAYRYCLNLTTITLFLYLKTQVVTTNNDNSKYFLGKSMFSIIYPRKINLTEKLACAYYKNLYLQLVG